MKSVENGVPKWLLWQYCEPIKDAGVGFGPTHNLSSIDDSFKEGIMSKLYDGRVRCDGRTYARTRVQIDKTGYSTKFPKTMMSGKYFGVALRGQTSYQGNGFEAKVELKISLYQKVSGGYKSINFNLNNVNILSNSHGDTTFVYFYFDRVLGENYKTFLTGVEGMSMTFKLLSENISVEEKNQYGVVTDDHTDLVNPHYSLMLYEVMLPSSTWN
ncbi:MAG: hypothetical protein HUJ61_05940 [Bacilli bacterium]|nr:hypothetical protein [Bacilli bacterium]